MNISIVLTSIPLLAISTEVYSQEKKVDYNIIVILADDMGYSDAGCYGGERITPNIDRLAESGMRFTGFYASPICSPSRASLLTGCYPQRVGIPGVLSAGALTGIHPDELLLPEMLKSKGYQTALYGKWHLGSRPMFHPMNHGFDEFFGTPGSNDMPGGDLDSRRYGQNGLVLMEGKDTLLVNPPQWKLTGQYTEKAVDFIERNRNTPFFLYLAHNMPHTPIFVSNAFAGKSGIDLYHDVIMEIDASVGRIIKALEDNHLREKTLVVFLSDNGPWLIFGNHGGSAAPLSGGKKQSLEGGVRVPAIFSLPGTIPASRITDELVTMMDVYPTIAELTNSELPKTKLDGRSIFSLLKAERGAEGPHEVYYYYYVNSLQAVRSGKYKLQLEYPDRETPDPENIGYDGLRGLTTTLNRPLALFDLKADPSEKQDISAENPRIVKKMLKLAEDARQELGDDIRLTAGKGVREPGRQNR